MRDTPVAQAIRWAVDTHPDSVAVRTPDGALTYREFGAAAQRLADRLDTVVGPRGFVGIDGTRGAGPVVAMVACLWAGRPFVVVDPRDSEASTEKKFAALDVEAVTAYPAGDGADLGAVDVLPRPRLARRSPSTPDAVGRETPSEVKEQLAYAVFTSGSTGEAKCVLVAAEPLAPMVADHVTRLEVGPGCRTLQFARLTFDGCITEILWTLTSGACLVVVGEAALTPGTELAATLETYGVTHLKTTPFALTETSPPENSSLVHVINGGGPCRQAVVQRWSAVAAFHNAYGLTETTVCNLLTPPLDPDRCRDGVPLGEVVGDCAYALEPAQPASDRPGTSDDPVRGELVIRGRSVGVGYLTDDGITRFRDADDQPVYRTGDVVERRGNELFYVERLDRRLKVRGYRIDPGEIEAAACRLPSVREAVVLAESVAGAEAGTGTDPAAAADVLACYYVGEADARDLRTHLETVVERYKVPSVVKRVERMPYTPNGKVDREALRRGRAAREADGGAPRTPEDEVLDLVSELTGVENVRPEDNFFEIGGDSATTLLLVNRLRELGWADAAVRDVLRAENLAVLVDRLPTGTV